MTIPRPLWQRYIAVLVYLVVTILFTQALALVLVGLQPAAPLQPSSEGLPFRYLMHGVIVQMVAFLIPAPLLIKFVRGRTYAFSPVRLREIFLCCALVFASLVAFSLIYNAFGITAQQLGFLDRADILRNKAAFLVITSVAVPAYEEWVFRGVIFGVLTTGEQTKFKILLAAIVSAALFTASHIEGVHSLSALPPIFSMAMIFQYMTWRTASLWPAVAAHAMQNLISSAALFAKFAPT